MKDAYMKLVIPIHDVVPLVVEMLARKGIKVDPGQVKVLTHTEGQFDDATEVFDGFEVDVGVLPDLKP